MMFNELKEIYEFLDKLDEEKKKQIIKDFKILLNANELKENEFFDLIKLLNKLRISYTLKKFEDKFELEINP